MERTNPQKVEQNLTIGRWVHFPTRFSYIKSFMGRNKMYESFVNVYNEGNTQLNRSEMMLPYQNADEKR